MKNLNSIKIGDFIEFRAITRGGNYKAIRKVNGFINNKPTVKFIGWSDFIVEYFEIIKIVK